MIRGDYPQRSLKTISEFTQIDIHLIINEVREGDQNIKSDLHNNISSIENQNIFNINIIERIIPKFKSFFYQQTINCIKEEIKNAQFRQLFAQTKQSFTKLDQNGGQTKWYKPQLLIDEDFNKTIQSVSCTVFNQVNQSFRKIDESLSQNQVSSIQVILQKMI